MKRKKKQPVNTSGGTISRRQFVKTTITGSVAAAGTGIFTNAGAQTSQNDTTNKNKASPPSRHELAMEEGDAFHVEGYSPEQTKRYFVNRPGSDVMVDIFRTVGLPYMALNPASSFRGLQESIANYAGNVNPQILTCTHEEQAAAIAHGYAKLSGKPMGVLAHGTVGVQHAAMAVYNAYADRVPMIILGSTHIDSVTRTNYVGWLHSANDTGKIIRDFTKWDAAPVSLQGFAEAFVRAIKIATTPPMGPVYMALDAHLQEKETSHETINIPPYSPTQPPIGDEGALQEAANMLIAAENPVIVADRLATTPVGMQTLIELAEVVQAPVIDKFGRMNFPSSHYLNQTFNERQLISQADFILALEVQDVWGVINRVSGIDYSVNRKAGKDVKVATINAGDLYLKSNYQSFQRYYGAELSIGGDGEATLPYLLEKVKKSIPQSRRNQNRDRKIKWQEAFKKMRTEAIQEARHGWNASPISTARLSMELWDKIKGREWTLTPRGGSIFQSRWPQKLWDFTRHYNHIGSSGAAGLGYGAPASVGAALANREHGRITVNIQGDGDFLYVPGAFWTAAHHKIPLLTIMHNNGGYHQEVMHLQRMATSRRRGLGELPAQIGTTLTDPTPDYAAVVRGLGHWATGPITNPDDLGPALDKALDIIDQGEPALIDVVCQPR